MMYTEEELYKLDTEKLVEIVLEQQDELNYSQNEIESLDNETFERNDTITNLLNKIENLKNEIEILELDNEDLLERLYNTK